MTHAFYQVDVFSAEPFRGNPLAVVCDADGLSEAQMAAFARWTNLSETTFLLAPTDALADYRVRIFTPGGELPFAGHPTLGSCAAWLLHGGTPRTPGRVVQECGIGLVTVKQDGARLAFAAPPLRRSGPVEGPEREQAIASLGVEPLALEWIDNGPGWMGARLE
ncbi:MAG: PhzF family phenazine biosynthesis protein, partial [Rubrivivax sp.]